MSSKRPFVVGTLLLVAACSDDPSGPGPAAEDNIEIAAMYVVQAVQTIDSRVPIIAGREAYLRVFPRSNRPVPAPVLRVRIYNGATLLSSTDHTLPGGSIPTQISQATKTGNWNIHLPPDVVRPGLRIEAELDPEGTIEDANEADNRATLEVTVHEPPPLRLRFVPVHQTYNGLTGNVTEANKESYLTIVRKIFPVAEVEADVRAAYTVGGGPFDPEGAVWQSIVSELDVARVVEGSGRYYYGVVRTEYPGGGVVGIAAGIPSRTALGWDRFPNAPNTVAHELGHNFGRRHVPCGGAAGADPDYPYPIGMIGSFGMDPQTGELKTPNEFTDIMGYCDASWWISDYTFVNVLNYRAQADAGMSLVGGKQNTLVVWGRVSDDELILEPAFRVVTRPSLPQAPGPYRLEGLADDGTRLFQISFQGERIEHAKGDQRIFTFAIPLDEVIMTRLAALRLTGAGRSVMNTVGGFEAQSGGRPGAFERNGFVNESGAVSRHAPLELYTVMERSEGRIELDWDATTHPAVMVRDPLTREVLGIVRGGRATVFAEAGELELIASDGVSSATRRVRVGME